MLTLITFYINSKYKAKGGFIFIAAFFLDIALIEMLSNIFGG